MKLGLLSLPLSLSLTSLLALALVAGCGASDTSESGGDDQGALLFGGGSGNASKTMPAGSVKLITNQARGAQGCVPYRVLEVDENGDATFDEHSCDGDAQASGVKYTLKWAGTSPCGGNYYDAASNQTGDLTDSLSITDNRAPKCVGLAVTINDHKLKNGQGVDQVGYGTVECAPKGCGDGE